MVAVIVCFSGFVCITLICLYYPTLCYVYIESHYFIFVVHNYTYE